MQDLKQLKAELKKKKKLRANGRKGTLGLCLKH